MPELPEVETVKRGLAPHLQDQLIRGLIVRQPRLRWPVPQSLSAVLPGERIQSLDRRGKYLLIHVPAGAAIFHLGMSGSLRILSQDISAGKHDHVDLLLASGLMLRLHDPRRFGALLWAPGDPMQHKLLASLGPEPLSAAFDGAFLHASLRGKKVSIKQAIMDSHRVVGVGNIYANEALFGARIHPRTAAGRLSLARSQRLVASIKAVLSRAIKVGGTTLKDFVDGDGQAGYFQIELQVYGREGEPCRACQTGLRKIVLGGRSTFYCPRCQRA